MSDRARLVRLGAVGHGVRRGTRGLRRAWPEVAPRRRTCWRSTRPASATTWCMAWRCSSAAWLAGEDETRSRPPGRRALRRRHPALLRQPLPAGADRRPRRSARSRRSAASPGSPRGRSSRCACGCARRCKLDADMLGHVLQPPSSIRRRLRPSAFTFGVRRSACRPTTPPPAAPCRRGSHGSEPTTTAARPAAQRLTRVVGDADGRRRRQLHALLRQEVDVIRDPVRGPAVAGRRARRGRRRARDRRSAAGAVRYSCSSRTCCQSIAPRPDEHGRRHEPAARRACRASTRPTSMRRLDGGAASLQHEGQRRQSHRSERQQQVVPDREQALDVAPGRHAGQAQQAGQRTASPAGARADRRATRNGGSQRRATRAATISQRDDHAPRSPAAPAHGRPVGCCDRISAPGGCACTPKNVGTLCAISHCRLPEHVPRRQAHAPAPRGRRW